MFRMQRQLRYMQQQRGALGDAEFFWGVKETQMNIHRPSRMAATALLAGLSLLLSGCFITPGKFTSELILTQQDRFTFTYEGEIFFLGLSGLSQMGGSSAEFEADFCYDEDTYEDRECTEQELADQLDQWEATAEMRNAESAQEAEQMAAMMGGIDPSDPEAAAELTALLLRQKGWSRVEDKGNGLFDVSYSVSGQLSHDFTFPVIEGFPIPTSFVQMILRDGDVVRINAPGFAAANEANPMAAMMGGMPGMPGMLGGENAGGEEGDTETPTAPAIDGTFTIVTDGTIRANNTDEGSNTTARGEELVWNISPRTQVAPTALIDMAR